LEMHTFMLDFGTYYRTGYKSLRIAASMRNFGPNVRPAGTFMKKTSAGGLVEQNYSGFSPPTNFTLGAAMEVYETNPHQMTVSFQMNHPMDNAETATMGGEYQFQRHFALRSGYLFGSEEGHWTFGAGAKIPIAGFQLQLDYAYADFGRLDTTQQFTMHFNF
jgi:hypothetical protein